MANQINGRVIAVSKVQTVASSDPSKAPLQKREVYIDCTRYDPYTGERSEYENKPLLEFSGEKLLQKLNPKLDAIQPNDIVAISFDIQGTPYKEKATGKTKVYTAIRCYDINVTRKANGQQTAQPEPQVQAPVMPDPQQPPMATSPFVGEHNPERDPLPF